jgi:hypothetical protein
MILVYVSDETLLRILEQQQTQSPEELLLELEEKLESGELSEDEVVQLLKDFTSRN